MRSGIALILATLGVGLFAIHAHWWLRAGVWAPLSIAQTMAWFGSSWAAVPFDWHGLHAVLQWLSLWSSCLVIAFVLAVWKGSETGY